MSKEAYKVNDTVAELAMRSFTIVPPDPGPGPIPTPIQIEADDALYGQALFRLNEAAGLESVDRRARDIYNTYKRLGLYDPLNKSLFSDFLKSNKQPRILKKMVEREKLICRKVLPEMIEHTLAHAHGLTHADHEALEHLAKSLEKGDQYMVAKLMIEANRPDIERYFHDQTKRNKLYTKLMQATIPELKEKEPKTITPELLTKMYDSGLLEYLSLEPYLEIEADPKKLGNDFYMEKINGRRHAEYQAVQDSIADELNQYLAHEDPGGEHHVNRVWIHNHIKTVTESFLAGLEQPMTSEIVDYAERPKPKGWLQKKKEGVNESFSNWINGKVARWEAPLGLAKSHRPKNLHELLNGTADIESNLHEHHEKHDQNFREVIQALRSIGDTVISRCRFVEDGQEVWRATDDAVELLRETIPVYEKLIMGFYRLRF